MNATDAGKLRQGAGYSFAGSAQVGLRTWFPMLQIRGETRGEYFNIWCEACNQIVSLHDARWVSGVPQIKATCPECEETGDFKVHRTTAMDVIPKPGT